MSASDALSPQQFMGMSEFKKLYSADYDEPMTKTMGSMQRDYREYQAAKTREPETYAHDLDNAGADEGVLFRRPSGELADVHAQDLRHGGPRGYVNHLKADIQKNGIQKPLTVRGGNVLLDGHHRGVAAMELGLPGVPVRHIR
jgi:hypothetical protein